jgi:hypothetical protein
MIAWSAIALQAACRLCRRRIEMRIPHPFDTLSAKTRIAAKRRSTGVADAKSHLQ